MLMTLASMCWRGEAVEAGDTRGGNDGGEELSGSVLVSVVIQTGLW